MFFKYYNSKPIPVLRTLHKYPDMLKHIYID